MIIKIQIYNIRNFIQISVWKIRPGNENYESFYSKLPPFLTNVQEVIWMLLCSTLKDSFTNKK